MKEPKVFFVDDGQCRRRRVVAELVKSDGKMPVADVLTALSCDGREDEIYSSNLQLFRVPRVDIMIHSRKEHPIQCAFGF